MDFEPLLDRWGIPSALLIAILFGLWRLAKWLGARIDRWIEPMVKAHINLANETAGAVADDTRTLKDLADSQQRIAVTQEKLTERLERLCRYGDGRA